MDGGDPAFSSKFNAYIHTVNAAAGWLQLSHARSHCGNYRPLPTSQRRAVGPFPTRAPFRVSTWKRPLNHDVIAFTQLAEHPLESLPKERRCLRGDEVIRALFALLSMCYIQFFRYNRVHTLVRHYLFVVFPCHFGPCP